MEDVGPFSRFYASSLFLIRMNVLEREKRR